MNLIVTNLQGESLPLLDYHPPIRTRNIDGSHTLSAVIRETKKNSPAFKLIEAEGKLVLDKNTYRIRKMRRDVEGSVPVIELTALHTFFDIIHDYQYDVIEGEKVLTLHQSLTHALEGTGITFAIEDDFDSQSFENFGGANCLNLFEKLRVNFGFEFVIENDTFLRIRKQIGKQSNQQMRWKHNIETIREEVDTTNLATYVRGTGKRDDDGNPLLEVEYTSPNADKYEKLYHADPVEDRRFTNKAKFTEYLKTKIVDKPELSYTIKHTELKKTGVESLDLGDTAPLIHEVLGLDFNTRVVEIIDFPTLPSRKPIYTISSKKESIIDKQVQANADKQSIKDDIKWSKNRQTELDKSLEKVAQAVAEVENTMVNVGKEMERIENEVLPEIDQAVKNTEIPQQVTAPNPVPPSRLWWDTYYNPPRFKRWTGTRWEAAVASGSLNINEIFSNSAVIAKIQSDIILATELNASKIVTGILNAANVSIINLSASSITAGILDAEKVRIRNINASEINTGYLNVNRLNGNISNFVSSTWNNLSSQVKITGSGLETYSGINRTSLLSGSGHRFYRDDVNIGLIGTANWINDSNYKGLLFSLDNSADYMAWTFRKNASDTNPTTMMSWHKTNAKSNKGFNFSDDVYISGNLTFSNSSVMYIRSLSTIGYTDGNRHVQLQNQTWNGYNGITFRRSDNGARLFLAHTIAALINSGNAYLQVGEDSTGNYVRSTDINNRTSTLSTQQVRVNNSGTLQMTSSSRRYKLLEKEIDLEYAKRILNVKTMSWYDKPACENYAHTLTTGEETDHENVTRVIGNIAEDMHDQGLELLVNYDVEGRPNGTALNGWVLHTPLIKDLYNQYDQLKQENEQMKSRLDKLETQMKQLIA